MKLLFENWRKYILESERKGYVPPSEADRKLQTIENYYYVTLQLPNYSDYSRMLASTLKTEEMINNFYNNIPQQLRDKLDTIQKEWEKKDKDNNFLIQKLEDLRSEQQNLKESILSKIQNIIKE